MNTSTFSLDTLVRDHKMAPDWVDALRSIEPRIDAKIDACLTKVAGAGTCVPTQDAIWRAFELPLADVRVLILGQDPYPDERHAVGLSFSTGPEGPVPASLRNIYRELLPLGDDPPHHGDLSPWTKQGVMLLNRALTLPLDPAARPRRHIRWWSPLATSAMKAIAIEAEKRPIAALLWGVRAQQMREHVEPNVEVFASSHPAPLSVARTARGEVPFRGSRPFGRVNTWFRDSKKPEIDRALAD